MYDEIIKWAGVINLILLIPILFRVPRAMRLATEADVLRRKAELLHAEIEREKVVRGITQADYYRDLREHHQRIEELYIRANNAAKEQPPMQ